VQALHQTTVIVVEDPEELFGEYPQLGYKLARLLARRLRDMNDRLGSLRSRWTDRRATAQEPEPNGGETQPVAVAEIEKAVSQDRAKATGAEKSNFDTEAFSKDALDVLDTIFEDSLGPAS
jgi:CRP-like cAMP-binding protein